jgi:hypothetical protein
LTPGTRTPAPWTFRHRMSPKTFDLHGDPT